MNVYEVGDRVRLTATFTDSAGTAADPTQVRLLVQVQGEHPSSYTYPGTVTKSATGVYYYDYDVLYEGIHDYRWVGTGAVVAADEGQFNVPNSAFF